MNLSFIQPPQVEWASGVLADGPLLRKSTRIQDLAGVFADEPARQQLAGERVVYDVEMLDTSPAEGELYTGVTHLYPGRVGRVFYDPGPFPRASRAGEVYFGLCGNGLLLLQTEQGEARLENVFAGSIHIIPGFTAHRLINTGVMYFLRLPCGLGLRGMIIWRWRAASNSDSLRKTRRFR